MQRKWIWIKVCAKCINVNQYRLTIVSPFIIWKFIVIKRMMTSFWTSNTKQFLTLFSSWTFDADYFTSEVYENLEILEQNIKISS